MKKSKKFQILFFVLITITLVISLGLKFMQNKDTKTVVSKDTFIPKLQKLNNNNLTDNWKSRLNDNQLFLLAIPTTDYINSNINSSNQDSNASEADTSDETDSKEDSSTANSYPYDYIALLDKDMNIVLEASDTFIVNSELGIIDINKPLILGQHSSSKNSKTDDKQYTYGVYDLKNNKWLIKRSYSYIYELNENYYCAYDKGNIPYLFRIDGTKVFEEIFDSSTSFKIVGKNIVVLNENSSSISIYTSSGRLIKNITAKYVSIYKNNIITSNAREDSIVYDENGNEVFTKNMLLSKNNLPVSNDDSMTIYQFNEESLFVEVQISHYFIITKLDGTIIKILDQEKESNSNLGLVSKGYFTYSSDLSELSFYNEDGNKYLTKDNNDYSDFVYPKYYYYAKNNTIELYDYANNETLTLDVSTLKTPYLSGVYNDYIFIFSHDDLNSVLIYYKDTLVYEGKQSYIELINDHVVITNVTKEEKEDYIISTDEDSAFTPYSALMDSKHIIFNQDGKKIYESKNNEKILSINDSFLQVMRDNSIGITDYKGNFLCKIKLVATHN